MSPYDDDRAEARATLNAADWYHRRAVTLRATPNVDPEDLAIALDILAHARRAELLDRPPSPFTIPRE